jgi:saccharopine dehydrogenase (NADP+, L-glutamate forming)
MLPRMQYSDGQLDMLLMQHKYTIEYADRFEYLATTMVDYGVTTQLSSMSRTVSLPVGICIRLVLQGVVKLAPGLYRPTIPELYTPILDELATNNINFVDRVLKVEQKAQ